jgi:hypothetical protein
MNPLNPFEIGYNMRFLMVLCLIVGCSGSNSPEQIGELEKEGVPLSKETMDRIIDGRHLVKDWDHFYRQLKEQPQYEKPLHKNDPYIGGMLNFDVEGLPKQRNPVIVYE